MSETKKVRYCSIHVSRIARGFARRSSYELISITLDSGYRLGPEQWGQQKNYKLSVLGIII
jgi:hypothetical protein